MSRPTTGPHTRPVSRPPTGPASHPVQRPMNCLWPGVILGSLALALAADLAAAPTPLRVAAVFWFVGVCPGMALVRLLGLTDPVAELTLAVATSLSVAALAAEGMALAHVWSSTGLLAGLAGLSAAALAVDAMRPRGSPPPSPRRVPPSGSDRHP